MFIFRFNFCYNIFVVLCLIYCPVAVITLLEGHICNLFGDHDITCFENSVGPDQLASKEAS